jgi:hypothetical protein
MEMGIATQHHRLGYCKTKFTKRMSRHRHKESISSKECQGIGTKNQSHQKNVKALAQRVDLIKRMSRHGHKESISSAHVWAHILLAIVCDFLLLLCLVFCLVPMFRWVV